jgi:hypothetical protein
MTARDVELLAHLRLLPSGMRPSALGYDDSLVGRAFYWFYALQRRRAAA